MELKAFLAILTKNAKSIILAGVLAGTGAYLISSQLQPSYRADLSVYVQKIPEQPAGGDFTYDGFYAQQAAESYTDTVVGLFESSAIHSRALQIAGKTPDAQRIRQLNGQTRIEKVAPRLIDIQVKSSDAEEAGVLVRAIFEAVSERLEGLASSDGANLNMKIDAVNGEPLVSTLHPRTTLNTVIGALVGMFIVTTGFLLKEYLLSARQ